MTNVAISGLPAATALKGPELVPVVQGGVTSKSTLTAVSEYVLGTYIDARNYAIDPTGATDSSVGGNLAISDAITQKKRLVWPSGYFRLDAPLRAFTGPYDSLQMEGQGSGAPMPSNPGYPSAANTFFVANYKNAPALVLNNNSAVLLKDFAIMGQNTAPNAASTQATGPSISQADYITAGCQTGRYAPYCGIAFDPFSNATGNGVTGISNAAQAVVTVNTGSGTNPFVIGQMLVLSGVVGMTQINGLSGTVTAVGGSSGAWTATLNINSTGFSTYTSGGSAVGLPCCTATITNITSVSGTTVVTVTGGHANPFQCGQSVTFSGVAGMTQINGLTGAVTAVGGNSPAWTITVNINSSAFSPYTSGGLAVASDAYASLATWYQPVFANDGSYACVVENVAIQNFVVGIAIGLSGNANLAADLTFRNLDIANCDVCYAIGQSQSRNLNIEYGNVTNARTGFDGLGYATQQGTPPQLLRQNFGSLYRIFAFDTWVGNMVVEDCYAESIVCFGQFGFGQQPGSAGLTFIGGDYSFGNPGWLLAPLLLETYSPTTFVGTGIGCNVTGGMPVLNFFHQSVPIAFERCSFGATGTGHAPHIGLLRDAFGYCRLMDCWVSNSPNPFVISNDLGRSGNVGQFSIPPQSGRLEANFQTCRVSNSANECVYIPYAKLPQITVGFVTSEVLSGNTLTFTCANVAQLQVNDILFWTILPQGYSLQPGYWVPALKITSISGTTVTCTTLFDQRQYNPQDVAGVGGAVGIAPNHWAPTQSLTCNMTNGSVTLTNVSPVTILQNGDFVTGAGIQGNTRVVSGGGTATVTISQAVLSSGTAVALYFGRLYNLTTTPAF